MGGVPVLRRGEQDEQEIVEKTAYLLAHGGILLVFESIEERGDDCRAKIGGKLALDFLLQILDFAIVEEIERRIEIVELSNGRLRRFQSGFRLSGRKNLLLLLGALH